VSTGNRSVSRVRRGPSRERGLAKAEWLLLAGSVTLSLVILEVFLRWYFPLFPSPYQPDDVLLVKLVPGAKKAFTRLAVNGGQRIVTQINSQGFRGEELRPLDRQKRIIVYGDSNVQAEFSELPATFSKQLESRLAPSFGTGIEVINAGVVSYGPDQYSLRLSGDIDRLRPALVVAVIFADNDFGDLIRNRIYRLNSRGDLELRREVESLLRARQSSSGFLERPAYADAGPSALAPGSYLVLSHSTDEFAPERTHQASAEAARRGATWVPRAKDDIRRMFNGRDLVDPGLVLVSRWRPDRDVPARIADRAWSYGGIARV